MGFFDIFNRQKKEEEKKNSSASVITKDVKKEEKAQASKQDSQSYVDPNTGQLVAKAGSAAKKQKKVTRATGNAHRVLMHPLVSERASELSSMSKYVFVVEKAATKHAIKEAVEKVYQTDVVSVRTMQMLGKDRRRGHTQGKTSDWKKAIVTLTAGKTIDLFEGK